MSQKGDILAALALLSVTCGEPFMVGEKNKAKSPAVVLTPCFVTNLRVSFSFSL